MNTALFEDSEEMRATATAVESLAEDFDSSRAQ